jgi:hypothetical protein
MTRYPSKNAQSRISFVTFLNGGSDATRRKRVLYLASPRVSNTSSGYGAAEKSDEMFELLQSNFEGQGKNLSIAYLFHHQIEQFV